MPFNFVDQIASVVIFLLNRIYLMSTMNVWSAFKLVYIYSRVKNNNEKKKGRKISSKKSNAYAFNLYFEKLDDIIDS